jgi:hypothetical protein
LLAGGFWNTLYTTNPAAMPFTFTDPNGALPVQFYRILVGPSANCFSLKLDSCECHAQAAWHSMLGTDPLHDHDFSIVAMIALAIGARYFRADKRVSPLAFRRQMGVRSAVNR